MSCNLVQTIVGSECIGDSRNKINSNFTSLETVVCNLSTSPLTVLTTPTIQHSYISSTRTLQSNVRDNSINTIHLSDDSVTTSKLSAEAVTTDKIALSAITTDKILNANITPAKLSQPLTLATAQATTSGTSIDFTGIPSWVKRITVMFAGVSTNGTSNLQIQIGSGSVTSSGYASNAGYISNGDSLNQAFTTGFVIINAVTASFTHSGVVQINLLGSNTWCESGSLIISSAGNNANFISAGSITLGGVLDRVRLTTVNGTDTFDAGSVNIMYEG
jgi:hypothetical protein